MNGQAIVVALLVAACAAYAAWTLMPRAARRSIATALLKRSWPQGVQRFLARHAQAQSGCGCDGCDVAASKGANPAPSAPATAGAAQPVVFHPRRPR